MTARWSAAIGFAVVAVLAFGALPAAPASTGRTPPKLYRVLRTTPFAPASVAGRFRGARLSIVSLSASSARQHAIGTVQVTFTKGEASIRYTVFHSHNAALNAWEDDVSAARPMSDFQARLHVYGIHTPNVLYLGACASAACDSYRSMASIVNGYVKIDVTVTALPSHTNYDQAATMILARAANTHLVRLS
jgi:hypothetical protein